MLATVFLIVAVILFVLSALPRVSHGAMVPIGLAFFAGSFLIGRI